MRRNRLFILTLLMLLPSIGAVLIAAFGVFHFQKTLETITRSYVENLAESLASRIQTRWDFIDPESASSLYEKKTGYRTFAGIGTLPGLIPVTLTLAKNPIRVPVHLNTARQKDFSPYDVYP